MRLILLGPPGAGKGTQAKLLSEKFNIPHISTGDLLRDEMREDSSLGKKVAEYVKTGELVPDEIVIAVTVNRLAKPDARKGFILDGFPRTVNQANKLKAALKKQELAIDLVIYFKTSAKVSIRRLSGRRVCRGCGMNFHLVNMPTKTAGICDYCGQKLFLRDDDKAATVKKRLSIYQSQTASLIEFYRQEGKLRQVSGDLEAQPVNQQILELFAREQLGQDS